MLRLPSERIIIFLTGIVLTVVFSLLIGLLNVGVLYLLGLPFLGLIAGITLIWFSRISIAAKVLLSVAPIPIIIGTFLLFIFVNTAEAEMFVIPKNYRGEIVVFYGEQCGDPATYDEGRRLYRLSSEGVLITQHTENKGYFNRKFYLINDHNDIEEIAQFGRQSFETEKKEWGKYTPHASSTELTKETVGVFWAYGRETYFISQNSIAYIVTDYRWFERDEKDLWQERKRFTARAAELLQQCRNHE